MPDELIARLRRFHDHYFPGAEARFRELVEHGQHPSTLFIGCSDSRLVPYLLTGAGPGDLFLVRNVGALVPPHDGYLDEPDADPPPGGRTLPEVKRRWVGHHGTAAAIEFAVLNLKVSRIIVCGHSHCGAMRALYEEVPPEAPNLARWLELAREAALPVRLFDDDGCGGEAAPQAGDPAAQAAPRQEVLRRTEQRAIVLQLERLMAYPMVRSRVESGEITLHGWHYVIEEGEVHVYDVRAGGFVPASRSEHGGTGPYPAYEPDGVFNEIDERLGPAAP